MPVKNLVEDLLKNGIDLSHLSQGLSNDSRVMNFQRTFSVIVCKTGEKKRKSGKAAVPKFR